MTTDESMQAVDTKFVDFTVIGADGALNWTRNKVKNVVVAFPVGDTTEVGWAFRKKDKDLQEAVRRFFDSQAAVGSRFDEIWKEKVGIRLSEFNVFITDLLKE
jgi:membrane-bound lytic murein transglycosylase MltF